MIKTLFERPEREDIYARHNRATPNSSLVALPEMLNVFRAQKCERVEQQMATASTSSDDFISGNQPNVNTPHILSHSSNSSDRLSFPSQPEFSYRFFTGP